MNLIDDNIGKQEDMKSKKMMIIIGVILVILLFVCIGLITMIYYVQETTLKVSIDGSSKKYSDSLFVFDENKDKVYIAIKEFAKLVGYEAYNGDYNTKDRYSEDTTKCYVENNYEVATFSLDSNKIYKTLKNGNEYEYYDIEEEIKLINDNLYVSAEGLRIGYNVSFNYNKSNNKITIYTLPYLVTTYSKQFKNSAISGEKADFSNQKALLYNMIVLTNENGKYGVYSLEGKEIIGTKYASIKFIESSKDFIVTTDERKMGIISSNALTKIQPEYDNIKQLDRNLNFYLVTNNRKQGIIKDDGSFVVHLEYDQIGIDTTKYANSNIKNQYLLFDNCIPVKRDGKWGLYDKTGKLILPIEYNNLGCTASTQTNKSTNNIIIIPQYEAIVIEKDGLYGIINSVGKQLLPCVLKSVYSVTTSGEETFYMDYNDKTIDLEQYFETYIVKKDDTTSTNTNKNTVNNTQNTTSQENANSL